MQNILNSVSVSVNEKVAAAEGWSVPKVSDCIMQLVQEEKNSLDAVMEKLDQTLREYAGSAYEWVKNLHPSQLGDEPWEQVCAEVISVQMAVYGEAYYFMPCVYEVAYMLDVEPSSTLASCVKQLNSQFSYWGENIVGRD